MGIIALAVEHGHAAIKLIADALGDILMCVRNNQGDLGIIQTVNDLVKRKGGEKQRNCAIEGVVKLFVHDAGGNSGAQIHAKNDFADGKISQLHFQQSGNDVNAAGRCFCDKDQTEAGADHETAEDGSDQRLDLRNGNQYGKQVKAGGRNCHAQQGTEEKPFSDVMQTEQKQRKIKSNRQQADGQPA